MRLLGSAFKLAAIFSSVFLPASDNLAAPETKVTLVAGSALLPLGREACSVDWLDGATFFLAAGSGALMAGGGGGAALGFGAAGCFTSAILTFGFGLALGAGANLVAGLGGADFITATFFLRIILARVFRLAVLRRVGFFNFTGGRSTSPKPPADGGRVAKIRESGILLGGSRISPVRLRSATELVGPGPKPLSPTTLISTNTSLLEFQGLSWALAPVSKNTKPAAAIMVATVIVDSLLIRLFGCIILSFPLIK